MTPVKLNLTFSWSKIDDPNPTSRRVRLPGGNEARIFRSVLDGEWFAVVNERSKSGLGSEEDAISYSEQELERLIRADIEEAKAKLAVYDPLIIPENEMEAA